MAASLSFLTPTFIDWHRNRSRMTQLHQNADRSGPISSSKEFEYDVFLSFRGEDTRYGFTSFLYRDLKNARLHVYKDNVELEAGNNILPALMEAIEKSRLSIPIFSKNYAESKSCLHEVAKINECRRKGQIVIPIFYKIEPSDVKKKKGPFEKFFLQHRKSVVDSGCLDQWEKALDEIGRLKGYTVERKTDQAELVEEIVSVVVMRLRTLEVPVEVNLLGIEQRVEAVVKKLHIASDDVRVLGICGVAGIGKTALAEKVYNKLCGGFDGCSFISKIREGDILYQQSLLISQLRRKNFEKFDPREANRKTICHRFKAKKVLIILDDVDERDHLKEFGVDVDVDVCKGRFGPGSRIILTTRKSELLDGFEIYPVEHLSDSHGLQLFCKHAFKKDSPERGYDSLSSDIASATGGNPSLIRLVGSRLSSIRNKKEWSEVLKQLKDCTDLHISELLRPIYYKLLNEKQQKIYLDIACFLRGESFTIASYMWEDCQFHPITAIKTLVGMSLLTIGENDEMLMDHLVSNYGQTRVSMEHNDLEMRSRLWIHEHALKVLKGKEGSGNIKAMCLHFDNGPETSALLLMAENFVNLSKLRFLRLDGGKIGGNFENFVPKLRWLDWKNCPEFSEEVPNLYLEKLVILDMSRSNVTHDWEGWDPIKEKATNLKVLQLAKCNQLKESPTFPKDRQLERLNFEGSSQLTHVSIPPSTIETLVYLNIKDCHHITKLPEGLSSMVALETLIIDGTSVTEISFGTDMTELKKLSACGCKGLKLDDTIGELNSLSHLALDDTGIETFPNSICSLTSLQTLSLRNCKQVEELPCTIGQLKSLVKMDLSYTLVSELPSEVKDMKSLEDLSMAGTRLSEFPEDIAELKSLKNIDFSGCRCMKGRVPNSITNLSSLNTLKLSYTEITSFPADISGLSQLQFLEVVMCELTVLPKRCSSTFLYTGPHK